jgi:hypothetical protein
VRKNSKLVVPMAALAVAISLSITGQEEPLPVVRAKTSLDGPVREPANYLLVSLNRPFDSSLLADAARANDFAAFDALYKGARKLGQPVAAYSTLHELWAWSMTDPVGGFYGQETHDRFASSFSGYARYIEEYRIVDSKGHAFYPTSETRAFLLARALEGQSALSPVIARRASVRSEERGSTTKSQPNRASQPSRTATGSSTRSVTHGGATHGSSSTHAHRTPARPKTHVASTPAVAKSAVPESTVSTQAAPTQAAKAPVKTPATATPVVPQPAGGNAGPAPSAAITTATNPPTTTAAPTPTPVTTEAPIVVKAEEPAPVAAAPVETQTAAQTTTQSTGQPVTANPFTNRGMLLLVIGLIGFGILALILRTPKEVPTSILPPTPAGKPPAPVEPFRKTPTPGSQKTEDSKKPRATGSHG